MRLSFFSCLWMIAAAAVPAAFGWMTAVAKPPPSMPKEIAKMQVKSLERFRLYPRDKWNSMGRIWPFAGKDYYAYWQGDILYTRTPEDGTVDYPTPHQGRRALWVK